VPGACHPLSSCSLAWRLPHAPRLCSGSSRAPTPCPTASRIGYARTPTPTASHEASASGGAVDGVPQVAILAHPAIGAASHDALWMGFHSRCAHGNLAILRRAIYQRAAHRGRAWYWSVRRCDEADRKCFDC
jgi:hypothetical protein